MPKSALTDFIDAYPRPACEHRKLGDAGRSPSGTYWLKPRGMQVYRAHQCPLNSRPGRDRDKRRSDRSSSVPFAYLRCACRVERQWRHKNAGVRTHALVSVGASTFGLISLLGFGATNNPMLIAGGVVTGIGFIGGGVIMHQGGMIQGINTAATLWA